MHEITAGRFAPPAAAGPASLKIVDWNIARGVQFRAVANFLAAQNADLLTLQEADVNTRRAEKRDVAAELARELKLDFVFAREFQELGQGRDAYTGQAILSRWPISNARVIRFTEQTDFWRPRWYIPNMKPFQERLGGRIALAAEVQVPGRVPLAVYNLHLESREGDALRMSQLEQTLNDASSVPPQLPCILAGDLNFETARGTAQTLIGRAGFTDAVPLDGPTRGRESIDRALIRGPLRSSQGRVDRSTKASDHYPLLFSVDLS